jgi:hypothetical protein
MDWNILRTIPPRGGESNECFLAIFLISLASDTK